jgi:hypothetical protein
MATRCPRCQKNEIALETFGVYRCPACGRIDADGKLLDIAAPPPDVAPEERVSFAPPPPKAWTPPGATERVRPMELDSGSGPPTLLYAGVALMFFMSLANALTSGGWLFAVLRWGTLGALWTGRPWARTLSIFGSGLTIVGLSVMMAVLRSRFGPTQTAVVVVSVIAEVGWLYVLFRPETVRHFLRSA